MSDTEAKARPKGSLNKEEHRQLLVHHMSGLRAKLAEVKELKEPLAAAQEEFTALVNQAKADLGKGYSRKYLLTLLEDSTSRLRNLLEEENRRAIDREALGLPVYGVQADLFGDAAAKLPDEARDERQWEAEGFMRGRNGAIQEVPEGCPPRFTQAVMRGYEAGQKLTQADYLAAQELIKARGEPDAGVAAVDLNGGALDPDSEEGIAAAAAKLKAEGFTKREGEGAEPDPDAPVNLARTPQAAGNGRSRAVEPQGVAAH